jgi:hypothetical protein
VVASRIGDLSAMLDDLAIHAFTTIGLDIERLYLILLDAARVTRYRA